jgi:hypothetical protein
MPELSMKINLLISAVACLGLVACSAPQGAGFSGIGAEPVVDNTPSVLSGGTGYRAQYQTQETYRQTYVQGATAGAVSSRAAQSVLQRNGVPLSVTQGRSKPLPNQQMSVLVAGRRAVAHASSRWGAKHTVPLTVGQNSARLKAVTVDGLTFGVVGKIKGPTLLGGQDQDSLKQEVVSAVTSRTGCAYGGETVVQRDQYGTVHKVGVLLSC